MKKLLQQALAALSRLSESNQVEFSDIELIESIRTELEKPEQEPVAWRFVDDRDNNHPTYRSTPPTPEQAAYLAKWERPSWEPLYTKGTTNAENR